MRWNFKDSRWVTKNKLVRFTIVCLAFICGQQIQAQEWTEFYNNTRSMGMGGVAVTVASDETSLFRNPANLGSVRDIYGTIFDPELEGSSNFLGQVSSDATSKAFEIEEVKNILDTNREQYYHAKLQLTPSVVRRNFGFGLISRKQIHAEVDATGTTMNTHYQDDLGAVLGANYRFFDGRIKIGGSAKLINRIEVSNPTLSTAGPFDLETIASEGTAISYDAGIMIQFPWKYLPTLGAVAHDVGDAVFDYKDGVRLDATSQPADVKQSVDVGISVFPIHANQFRSVWTLEYADVTNSREEEGYRKRAKFGAELNWRDLLFVRFGLHQMYWTAGFEIASERFSWQVASYGEEVGTFANGTLSAREDRRFNTKFTFRF